MPDYYKDGWHNKRTKKIQRLRKMLSLRTGAVRTPTTRRAGTCWAQSNSSERWAAEEGIRQAREMITAGLISAKAGVRHGGRQDQKARMVRWFGNDPQNHELAALVLNVVESHLVGTVHAYYRGKHSLAGTVTDAPEVEGMGAMIDHKDIACFGYTMPTTKDCKIFLSEEFFKLASTRGGFDALGGVLIHEMTHNLCNTMDYAYSKDDALALAVGPPNKQHRPVMNADNHEYFCEELFPSIAGSYSEADAQLAKVHSEHARVKLDTQLTEEFGDSLFGDFFGDT